MCEEGRPLRCCNTGAALAPTSPTAEVEMSLTPIFPQFAKACVEFVKPRGFPRPFAALDWCPRCGQPDWAHQADGTDRIALLSRLGERQRGDMLRYVCEYSPATFDIALEAVTPPDEVADPAQE